MSLLIHVFLVLRLRWLVPCMYCTEILWRTLWKCFTYDGPMWCVDRYRCLIKPNLRGHSSRPSDVCDAIIKSQGGDFKQQYQLGLTKVGDLSCLKCWHFCLCATPIHTTPQVSLLHWARSPSRLTYHFFIGWSVWLLWCHISFGLGKNILLVDSTSEDVFLISTPLH